MRNHFGCGCRLARKRLRLEFFSRGTASSLTCYRRETVWGSGVYCQRTLAASAGERLLSARASAGGGATSSLNCCGRGKPLPARVSVGKKPLPTRVSVGEKPLPVRVSTGQETSSNPSVYGRENCWLRHLLARILWRPKNCIDTEPSPNSPSSN